MLLGYNTNGLAHHDCFEAIELLASLGYQSVAITIDHGTLNPYGGHFRQRIVQMRRLLEQHQMRSVVETLPLARSDDSRSRLLAVIEHDVRRLDRLISDISDASRLDAQLQRQDVEPVDIRRLLTRYRRPRNKRVVTGDALRLEVHVP